jgi:hypothetical protein
LFRNRPLMSAQNYPRMVTIVSIPKMPPLVRLTPLAPSGAMRHSCPSLEPEPPHERVLLRELNHERLRFRCLRNHTMHEIRIPLPQGGT